MTRLNSRVELTSVKVSLKLPFIGDVSGEWKPDEGERRAAWEMYVELITRISVAELGPEEGVLREALSSLYSLFGITRSILRQHGPTIAQPKDGSTISFGYLAVAVLNAVLRPVLARWHPLLLDYESRKPSGASSVDWERQWDKHAELRQALGDVRETLADYADVLAEVAQVPPLVVQRPI